MGDGPTIERRIRAAMTLAGLENEAALATRIATKGYSARTLYRMLDPTDKKRPVRDTDLVAIGKACGVSDAFWTVDFQRIQALPDEAALAEKVEQLDRHMAVVMDLLGVRLSAGLAGSVQSEPKAPRVGPANGAGNGPPG
jgi:hypothetical protein